MIGVDEAGRGPVLGPLVVAAVLIDDAETFGTLGVKDSKKLTPARRERLFQELLSCTTVAVESVEPCDIDGHRRSCSLNDIETDTFVRALSRLPYRGQEIYVDCCDTVEERFGRLISERLGGARVHSRHHADTEVPCVSAASIVAKVVRDRAIASINEQVQQRWGISAGSGYPIDATTVAFLRFVQRNEIRFPSFVRRSWATARRFNQSTLDAHYE
ncbi:MAG TPA: ribonuclease HII [Methanomicrobia archaeon]|nr:ribonuclease HII [Methanomicrobia archaeon]